MNLVLKSKAIYKGELKMSYEIYKSIKQLADGTFNVTSTSNNVYPQDFRKWNMDYFNKTFPELSNEGKRGAWLLSSLYYGGQVLS